MREESHLDDMRAAIRGDFERLAKRRGEHVLLRASPRREPPPGRGSVPAEAEDPAPARPRPLLARLLGR